MKLPSSECRWWLVNIGLSDKVKAAMASAEINAELVCPLGTPSFPMGTHDYDRKRHNLIERVSKCMISRQEAEAKFNEYREAQHEVNTDGFTPSHWTITDTWVQFTAM